MGREVAEKAQFGRYSDPVMSFLTVRINVRKVSRISILALYSMLWVSELFFLLRPQLCSKNACIYPWFIEALSI